MRFLFLLLAGLGMLQAESLPSISADTGLRVERKETFKILAHRFTGDGDTIQGVGFKSIAALHGERGLCIESGSHGKGIVWKTDFFREGWIRFYYRLDSITPIFPPNQGIPLDSSKTYFSGLEFSENQSLGPYFPGLGLLLLKKAGQATPIFCVEWHDQGRKRRDTLVLSIKPKQVYCLEEHFSFQGSDTLHLQVFCDNHLVFDKKSIYVYPRQFIALGFSSDASAGCGWRMSADDFMLSDQRCRSIPPSAQICVTEMNQGVVLKCDSLNITYQGELIKSSEWRVFSDRDTLFPIFHLRTFTPDFFYKMRIPFSPNDGRYDWQVRFWNNQDDVGDWSAPLSFDWKRTDTLRTSVISCELSETPEGRPVKILERNRWYWFTVRYNRNICMDSLGYLILILNDTANTLGFPANKGGAFEPKGNYIFNISMGAGFTLFEKAIPSSTKSTRLGRDSSGIYLDGRGPIAQLDTVKNLICFRGRVLDSANLGTWRLSAALFYFVPDSVKYIGSNNPKMKTIQSNIYYQTFQVVKPAGMKKLIVPSLLIILAGFFAFLVFRKKRLIVFESTNQFVPQEPDKELVRIVNYINVHLSEDLTVDGIRHALNLSYNNFYAIMNRNAKKPPRLINELRIDRAKALMREKPEKTVSEVALEVGFKTPFHFSNVFKEITGLPPKDFKQSLPDLT